MKIDCKNIVPLNPDCIHIVQVTDPHVFASNGQHLKGIDTAMSLEQVISMVNNDIERPDLILATGDLAHDPSPAAYEKFRGIMETTNCPVFCLPGNHDRPALMDNILNAGAISTCKSVCCGEWEFLLLDSVMEGDEKGFLRDSELQFLRTRLLNNGAEHIVVCLHHHPVEIGSPWLDRMKVANGDALLVLVREYPQIRCVIWGHIHQDYTSQFGQALLVGSPSTCIQFKPGTLEFEKDVLPPGYRKFRFHHDGRIDSSLHWLDTAMEHDNVIW